MKLVCGFFVAVSLFAAGDDLSGTWRAAVADPKDPQQPLGGFTPVLSLKVDRANIKSDRGNITGAVRFWQRADATDSPVIGSIVGNSFFFVTTSDSRAFFKLAGDSTWTSVGTLITLWEGKIVGDHLELVCHYNGPDGHLRMVATKAD
jgi:hypothetical protein